MSKTTYLNKLSTGSARLGVWGLGSIGTLSLLRYSEAGFRCVGYDVSPSRVAFLNRPSVETKGELQRDAVNRFENLIQSRSLIITNSIDEILSIDVVAHLVCVPTEIGGEPTLVFVKDVCEKIARSSIAAPLVIIESTLTPGSTENTLIPALHAVGRSPGSDILLAVSPRRDWIDNDPMDYREMHRVMGAIDQGSANAAKEIIQIISPKLHHASSVFIAEMAKCIENAYRFVDITFANQLAMAFPKANVTEALRLAGTKWNTVTFYPGLRPAGHCIPVAARHLLKATEEDICTLSLINESINYETAVSERVARVIHAYGIERVLILGFSYQANVRVSLNSPAPDLINYLKAYKVECHIADPFFSVSELAMLSVAHPVVLSTEMPLDYDCILLLAAHDEFRSRSWLRHVRQSANGLKLVIDTTATWKSVELPENTRYTYVGDGQLLTASL